MDEENLMAQVTSNNQTHNSKHPTDIVQFTPLQLEYLQTMFPQIVYNANHTEASMRHYFGSQAVLNVVREKTSGLAQRNKVVSQNDIPSPE